MHVKHTRLMLSTVLATVIILSGCPDDQTLTLIASLTKDRQAVEASVKEIKKTFNPSDAVYQEAKHRYLTAYSTYTGYVTALRVSIQTGLRGDLSGLALHAETKGNDFISYVQDNLPQSRSLLSLLPRLGLTKLINYVISVRREHRQSTANIIYEAVQWKEWDGIQ